MPDRSPLPATIPIDSQIFGYGPMLPFICGALGSWLVPSLLHPAVGLTVIWGGLILSFLGGVRRGFGFGDHRASTRTEIQTMIVYVSIGGLALILAALGLVRLAVTLLALGFIGVAIADHRAARAGDAPAHFALLRPRQMSIASISLLVILARLLLA